MSHDSREMLPPWANVFNMCCTDLCKSQHCWMTFRVTFREKTFAWMLLFFIIALGWGGGDFNMTDFYKSACKIQLIKVFVHSYNPWHEPQVSGMRPEGCVSSSAHTIPNLMSPVVTWPSPRRHRPASAWGQEPFVAPYSHSPCPGHHRWWPPHPHRWRWPPPRGWQ